MKSKNIKSIFLLSTLLVPFFSFLLVTSSYGTVPEMISEEPNRDEILWATGVPSSLNNYNPWNYNMMPWTTLMFETLFGYNEIDHSYFNCIGINYNWLDDGRVLQIDLNPNAMWSDGTPIDGEDVEKSFELAQYQYPFMDVFSDKIESFSALNSYTVEIILKPNAEYSRAVMKMISNNMPIVPWHVYNEVNEIYVDENGHLDNFNNNWFDPTFNEAWKVCSGPYAPVYLNEDQNKVIFQFRDDWWGKTDTYSLYPDLPNWNSENYPKYVGYRYSNGNLESKPALENGELDLMTGGILDMGDLFEDKIPGEYGYYVNSWYEQVAPYQAAFGQIIGVGVNHQRNDLFNQPWFREALSWCIDYDRIPDPSSNGIWRKANPGYLDDESSVQSSYFDDSVKNEYYKSFVIARAAELMELHGYQKGDDGIWEDVDTHEDIGPFKMICPASWTDVEILTQMICEDFTTFGIPTEPHFIITWSTNWASWEMPIIEKDYDFMMWTSPNTVRERPEIFLDQWSDLHSWNRNVSGWYSAESIRYEDLRQQLDTTEDDTIYQNILNEMQLILAQEIPQIPCFYNVYYYTYNEYFWEGWVNNNNQFQQICSDFTVKEFLIKQRMVLNLISTGRPYWVEQPVDQYVIYRNDLSYDINAEHSQGISSYWISDTTNFNIDENGVITNNIELPIGTYELEVQAYSSSGLYTSARITVYVDIQVTPTWEVPPTDQILEFGDNFIYDVDAYHPFKISQYIIDNPDFTIDENGIITNLNPLDIGNYIIEIQAYEPWGSYCSTTITITVVDTTSPSWTITPSDQNIQFGNSFQYMVSASDTSGISLYWISDNTNFNIDSNGVITSNTILNRGVYDLAIIAYDPFGNFCSINISIIVRLFGDVNGDNKIDINDALLIAQYFVGLNPVGFTHIENADVNGDGSVNIVDSLLIAQYYVGLIDQFPVSQ